MRPILLSGSVASLCFSFQIVAARLLHNSLPEDTYAFPKYRVTFLNGLPVQNETAERWLRDGLRGGQVEFLDQPWKEDNWNMSPLKEIDGGDEKEPESTGHTHLKLENMKLGRLSYLCLIPPPLHSPPPVQDDDPHPDVTPAHSWSLLQPLAGTCLYHRQGWFTYSYCHNKEIRQFRELPITHVPAGGYQPEEDPDWESYTLGQAPPTPEPGVDLTVAEQTALAANLELARGAGSRYLVQKWGDGTVCDKTGRKREIEVQFHCSMTMTDTIIFVKEAKTCSYVLVIHTPRLCGEPGFKSRVESREEAPIRCREIVDATAHTHEDQGALPEADHPIRLPRKPKHNLPPLDAMPEAGKDSVAKEQTDQVRRVVEALVGKKGFHVLDGELAHIFEVGDEGEVVVEFDVDTLALDGDEDETSDLIQEALVAAGFEVKGEKKKEDKKKGAKKAADENANDAPAYDRDEL